MVSSSGGVSEAIDFASLLAHELTQPLTAAMGCVSTLARKSRMEQQDALERQMLTAAMRNLIQLQRLIDSLRLFADVENGAIPLRVSHASVNDLFSEVLEDFIEPLDQKTLEVSCDPELWIDVDITLFRQVLTNLVANASKFGEAGSRIDLIAIATKDGVGITLHNFGQAIVEEDYERIFEKSVRLDLKKRGLGLGLYVSRAIIEAHAGRLWVESDGVGTTFHIDLRAAA